MRGETIFKFKFGTEYEMIYENFQQNESYFWEECMRKKMNFNFKNVSSTTCRAKPTYIYV